MRTVQFATILLVAALFVSIAGAADYVITVNGTSKDIDLGRKTTVALPEGTILYITLHQKEYLCFSGDLFQLEHKSKYKPNRNDLGGGIFQTSIITPLGTGIVIQEYTQQTPAGLVDSMIRELTKEEVDYGYTYREEKVQKQVDGGTFSGKQAVTTLPDEEWTRNVLANNHGDKSVLVLTFIERDNYEKESALIEQLWKTLKIEKK